MAPREFKTVIGSGPGKPDEPEFPNDGRLVVISGHNLGKVFLLKDGVVTIGRGEESVLLCPDPLVSRQHARVLLKDNAVVIEDLGSTNGTFVNFRRIHERKLLDGDKISIGQTVLKFMAANAVETAFHDELYNLAWRDGMTQAYNKTKFLELLNEDLLLAQKSFKILSLCMFDLDHFKQINDTYGHQAGDYVLSTFSELVRRNVRKEDIFARYGGEEFCLLLTDQNEEQAIKVAEKIRATVAEYPFLYGEDRLKVTVSAGVAMYEPKMGSAEKFIGLADEKLYEAKHNGRNCVRY